MIIKKIALKKGTKESSLTKISNWLDGLGKFLEKGIYYIVAKFDDEMDLLAFMVSSGLVKIRRPSWKRK